MRIDRAGEYFFWCGSTFVADLGIPVSSALERLRADHIRYVIVDGRRKAVATALGIRPALEQYGLAIYEIPPAR
ncbi:MAG TPA: hypothetical protein VF461_23665 [Gemmatimonadaceae bacterium]